MFELRGQGTGSPAGRRDPGLPRGVGDPVVDHPRLQVVGVDPVGHRGVVPIGDKHRQGEPAQQPFRRALPVRLLGTHRDQLPGERQCVCVKPELPAHPGAQVQLTPRDVVRVLAQADQLGVDLGCLVAELLGRVAGLRELVLRVREILPGPVASSGDLVAAGGEMVRGLDRIQASLGEQLAEPLGAVHPVTACCLALFEQAVDFGEPVPSVARRVRYRGSVPVTADLSTG